MKPSKNGSKSAGRENNGHFKRGNKGGPGRGEGSRNKATIMLEKLMIDDSKAVIEAVIKAAKNGDMQAAKMVVDRLVPAPKGRRIHLDLPEVDSAADVLKAMTETLAAMAVGKLTPDEAATVAGVIEVKRRAVETVDLERRITAIEEARTGQ